MTEKKLSDNDYARLSDFRYALRKYLNFSQKAAESAGLCQQQHQALLTIRGSKEGKITISELAERLCIRHNTAVELSKRLEMAKLIQRRPNPEDGRAILLSLTATGSKKITELTHTHRAELKQFRPEIAAILKNLDTSQ
jgi:DNA-binding MarR family transcriptional regulator